MFVKLFKEVYSKMFFNQTISPLMDEEALEEALENYIMKVMGYGVINEYRRCIKSNAPFPYYSAVRRWFKNLIQNFDVNNSRALLKAIEEYGSDFYQKISFYPYVDELIKGIKDFYSPSGTNPNIVIDHQDKMYKIFLVDDKQIEGMPVLVINNIETLNNILRRYIEAVMYTDNYYKKIIEESFGGSEQDKISELLRWTIINISNEDALDLERYFNKFTSFLTDDTLDTFKLHPVKIGELFDDEMYLKAVKSTCAYETPFYLAFMLRNKVVELPNVRIGIEDNGNEKIAHILSIQTTQTHQNKDLDPIINREIRDQLPRSPFFREFNPSHLVSLVITLGLLNGAGINKINAYEYLPLRYQRFVNEGRKNIDELNDYQHRLTNKFINTFFRLMEFTDGIEIISYPENGSTFSFKLKQDIRFNNELLDKVYQIGLSQSDKLNNYYKDIKEQTKIDS